MSDYKNFIQDFPNRCGQILGEYNMQTIKSGREVTHILAIASAALLIPFERLRKPTGCQKHPSGDKERYPRASSKLSHLIDQKFLSSELWKGEVSSWKTGVRRNLGGRPSYIHI